MKSLQSIQKTFGIFKRLSKLAMTVSFLGAFFSILGVILCYTMGEDGVMGTVLTHMKAKNLEQMTATLLSDFVFCLTDGILLLFTMQYFIEELAAGTPFTQKGAEMARSLGIKVMIMSLVAVIVSGVIHKCYGVAALSDIGNGATFIIGICLILFSMILRYGAELEQKM
jgi:hypothetical protein